MRRVLLMLSGAIVILVRLSYAQCGGEERWPVKMGADPDAAQVQVQSPQLTTLHDLVLLARPTLPTDDFTRVIQERSVWVIEGRLVKFKQETGKTGDSDFHLVISDETLLYSAGGAGSATSPHSIIAEVPDPDCIGGRTGSVTGPSLFQSQLVSVREKFVQQFPKVLSGWNDAGGIPVRLTGVAFFDRPHGQVGRALNGLELHPLLAIEFNPASFPQPPIAASQILVNPGFENGSEGWTGSSGVITTKSDQPAHSGTGKAWLGGYGESHSDKLSQQVDLPSAAHAISLSFFLHVDTEEEEHGAWDKLTVRIRDSNGILLQTLKTFSNQDAAPGFVTQALNLTAFRGKSIRIEFDAKEDGRLSTSFVLDDMRVIIENE